MEPATEEPTAILTPQPSVESETPPIRIHTVDLKEREAMTGMVTSFAEDDDGDLDEEDPPPGRRAEKSSLLVEGATVDLTNWRTYGGPVALAAVILVVFLISVSVGSHDWVRLGPQQSALPPVKIAGARLQWYWVWRGGVGPQRSSPRLVKITDSHLQQLRVGLGWVAWVGSVGLHFV